MKDNVREFNYSGLIKPFKICLLDEITVNLDLLVKDKFMNYLKLETTRRNCCIIYVTHIFDGLEEWATKLIYMKNSSNMQILDVSSIPNIYKYLLDNFKKDYVKTIESEDIKQFNTRKKCRWIFAWSTSKL